MRAIYDHIAQSMPHLTITSIVDILLVAFLVYQFLMILRGRRAAHILLGVLILTAMYSAASVLGLDLIRTILSSVAPYAPFALIVMFQSEIRRLLARIGRRRWLSIGGRLQKREFTEELVLALVQMSQQKIGALVVIERDIGLRTFIESGVMMDALLSRDLLLTIFRSGSALHDGAVIIRGQRAAAAACFLPLTVRPGVARSLGTRHRAAIGVTEETDCLSLVVSEETGRMSVVAFGDIEINVTPERLEERIAEHIIHKRTAPTFRQQQAREREDEIAIERESTRDAAAD
ncbi:MAG TPA: diadenylate cyclase CdaA [Bryobacteraceae bacterium]|nr:diadenylate cyclase CdaA [Bryobacteraceae bacterium]